MILCGITAEFYLNFKSIIIKKKKTTWKNRSIDYNKCEYLPDKKKSNSKHAFLKENWWNNLETPLFLRRTPLSTNPPISEQFFHDPPLCPNFKNETPSNFRGGRKLCLPIKILWLTVSNTKRHPTWIFIYIQHFPYGFSDSC